jgi:hypothetical protein
MKTDRNYRQMMRLWIPAFYLSITALSSGCFTYIWTGQTIHARVAVVVDPALFEKVRNGDPVEKEKNPYRTETILMGIRAGITLEDVHESRFVFCHCLSSNSAFRQVPWFPVLLPKHAGVQLGDDVALVAGGSTLHGNSSALSEFRQRLPERHEYIPFCAPD